MTNREKRILKQQLDTVYNLLKKLPNTKVKGTTEHEIVYELETINMLLDIEFND